MTLYCFDCGFKLDLPVLLAAQLVALGADLKPHEVHLDLRCACGNRLRDANNLPALAPERGAELIGDA